MRYTLDFQILRYQRQDNTDAICRGMIAAWNQRYLLCRSPAPSFANATAQRGRSFITLSVWSFLPPPSKVLTTCFWGKI
jgi:hypothetical protein